MQRIFADTDILLDLLAEREPFYEYAALLFSQADRKSIEIAVSSLSFATLNYLLSKIYSGEQAKMKLLKFKTLVKVLPVSDKIVELALSSDFKDFEDALQYYTATEHSIKVLLTRNLKDFRKAEITVLTAQQFLKSS